MGMMVNDHTSIRIHASNPSLPFRVQYLDFELVPYRDFYFKINEVNCPHGWRRLLDMCPNRDDRFNARDF
jgi:hypothetical protein